MRGIEAMKNQGWLYRRARRRAALKLGLLMLPALFWTAVFTALAGSHRLERAVEGVPDGVQVLVAVACPLLAVLMGLSAIGGGRRGGGEEGRALGRVTVAAGLALLAFAVLAALRPS